MDPLIGNYTLALQSYKDNILDNYKLNKVKIILSTLWQHNKNIKINFILRLLLEYVYIGFGFSLKCKSHLNMLIDKKSNF